ncbi:membrane dipeptidase-domain-containing protein [Fennellomyces sp. T-0311]|nr:membrane dipeptidase-domain-containing protein [Fennellomyces sp. T-0311]
MSSLFLPSTPNPTVQVADNIYRHRDAQKELIHKQNTKDKEGNTKQWIKYELDDYQWTTFESAKEITDKVAGWLQEQGLQAGDRMLIYSKTRPEWMLMALACCASGIVISTAYDSMPPESVAHIIEETEPKAILTEISLMGTLNKAKAKASGKHEPSFFVYTGEEFEGADQLDEFKSQHQDVNVTHWDDIVRDGSSSSKRKRQQASPKPDDLALIMYTSGTTGAPKGIEMTHGNVVAAMGAAEYLVMDLLDHGQHCYIGFLPLAHILEFILEFILISTGIPIGYATARTLMGDSVYNEHGKGVGDLESLKPTIMAGVPAIWERIRNGVLHELEKKHWTLRKAYEAAISLKWEMLCFFGQENIITRAFNATMFAPIRAKLGGRLMYAVSGGAPLSVDTHKFVTSTLGFLLQGYGLTECTGLGAITIPALGMVTGVIGPPSPSVEFRLVDVPETDYKAENGMGELWIRGPSRMRGYYRRPDLNEEALTEDGWFKTGDVAQLRNDGCFAITDRAKNLVKLSHGEYVALESLESKYRNNKSIKNICIQADSDKDYIVAVVEPANKDADKDDLLKELQETARQADCNRVEIIKDILVTRDTEWAESFLSNSGNALATPFANAFNIQTPFVEFKNIFTHGEHQENSYLQQANKLLKKHPLVDTHNDWPLYFAFLKGGKINDLDLTHLDEGHTDIERLEQGHVGGQFWSIYYVCEMKDENQLIWAMRAIDSTKRMIEKYPETFQYVTNTHDYKRAQRHSKLASMMGLEGGQYLYNSVATLRQLYELGIRYMTLTHNCHTDWAESCCDPNPPPFEKGLGLTTFGKQLVKEMNRIGMMVDISHVAHSTMHAVLNVTRAPVLFSHSSSNALCPIERNVPDTVLKRLDETDGVVMVNFYNRFVQCDYPNTPATLQDVADHIDHIASVAGRHRVGLGADYNGIEVTPDGLEDVSKYPDLFAELLHRGWTKKELKGLSSGNLLRVWKRVEEISEELEDELPFEEDVEFRED